MRAPSMRTVGLPLAVAALAALVVLSFLVGRYPVPPMTVLAVLLSRVVPVTPFWPPETAAVVLMIRLPRIAAAVAVGAALSSSGAAFQGIFRNPMVSPDILGVAAGAAVGAALALLWGAGAIALHAAAVGGGWVAVGATAVIAWWQSGPRRQGGDGALLMILAGIIVGTVFSALVSMVKVAADPTNTLPAITFWLMGGLAAVTAHDLWVAAVPMAGGLAVLSMLRWRLNILSFGDDEARALGVDVTRTRLAVIVAATVMTAAAVAIAGVIGLVGLVVPHLGRMVVGPNYKILFPTCTLMGAGFLLAVDDLARTLFAGEIPLGILTSLLGAPVFLLLLVKTGKGWTR